MLKGIDPVLNADVLHALRSMGHGDDLVICDTRLVKPPTGERGFRVRGYD